MAKKVKPKIKIAFNVLEGQFDYITDNNFSYKNVPTGKKLPIRENHQMIVLGCFEVDGTVEIDGELAVEE
jgi:hypothetical protein